ncbi:MAG: hypothetical protein GY803_04520 [Chloroflexi bacterium]|nr:hypothetical protein [Chloroflexota bacterium]
MNALLEQAGLELAAALDSPPTLEAIQTLSPSHILVEASDVKHQELVASLLEQEGITIIQLSLDNNHLQVFQRQDYAINHPSDLLDLLQNQP